MPHINLLPWRDIARNTRQKHYQSVLVVTVLLSLLLILLCSMWYGTRAKNQSQINQHWQTLIALEEQRIAEIATLKENATVLQQRIDLIKQWQTGNHLNIRLLNELAAIIPAGVYLTGMEKKGTELRLYGRCESNRLLSDMLRNVATSALLFNPQLDALGSDQSSPAESGSFSMRVQLDEKATSGRAVLVAGYSE